MRKNSFILLSLFLQFGWCAAAPYQKPALTRVEKTINTRWTFNYFPQEEAENGGYENPAFDDSKWSSVCVPHTWQTYETTRELHPYIRNAAANDNPYWWNGWGWYRKHLVIGKEYQGKKVYFEFDGVQKYARIFLNGKLLGDHKGGYTSFYVDATDAVRFGGDNLLTVAVNNTLKDKYRIPPMNAGNWVVYGGIFRDVRVVIKDPLHVPYQGSYQHEGGTFITTPVVKEDQAVVQVKTYLENNFKTPKTVKIVTRLATTDEVVFGKMESTKIVGPGEIAEFVQKSATIARPHLWTPETPYIYHAYTEVYDGNRLADSYHSTFGIRSVAWDFVAHRLVLNGKLIHLHGINRHEEYVWLGAAFPKWIANRDMMDMAKGLEINYMRTAHYPNDPSVYYFMDRNGIAIDEEIPNIKNQEFDPKVQEQNCREMIRRDRNHPSIVLWSMGNETDHACDSRFAWQEDTTRIITVRQPYNESYNPQFCKHTDSEMPVESFLRCTIRGWYDKDDRNLEPEDSQWAGTEEWQHTKSNESVISDHNGTVWIYADHGADREYVGAPLKHVNPKGWVDSWRTPKYVYYQWQANFAKKPMVFIHPHFWRTQYLGQQKDFVVDSNCDQVELFVNGKSRGILKPAKENNFNVTFKGILVEKGTIEAVARAKDGSKVISKVVMAGEPAALTIVPTHRRMQSTSDNLIEVKVDIVDKNGVHVYGANNTLKFDVSGPARLVGSDIYVSNRDNNEEYEGTMYIDAPVTNLIRAIGQTGKVKVTVSATGLKRASTEIEVVPYVDPAPVKGITEPVLNLAGREAVAINTTEANFLKAPVVMKDYAGELHFSGARQSEFRTLLHDFVVKENPGIDDKRVDFGYALDAFEKIMKATAKASGGAGYIVADDYNFIAAQYNVSCAIIRHLLTKKLPAAYQEELMDYFSKMIIANAKDKNFKAVNELIDQIPPGGRAVVIAEKGDRKGVTYLNETNLSVLLPRLLPEVATWSKEELKSALQLICRINPAANYKSIRDKKTKERTDSFTVEAGHTILIPEVEALKNANFPDKNL